MTFIVASHHMDAGHYRPASETPFWRFTGGPIAAQDFFAGYLHAFVPFACYHILFTYIFLFIFIPGLFQLFVKNYCQAILLRLFPNFA